MPGSVISSTSAVLVIIHAVSAVLRLLWATSPGLVSAGGAAGALAGAAASAGGGAGGPRAGAAAGGGGGGAAWGGGAAGASGTGAAAGAEVVAAGGASATAPLAAVCAGAAKLQARIQIPKQGATHFVPNRCIVFLCAVQQRPQSTSRASRHGARPSPARSTSPSPRTVHRPDAAGCCRSPACGAWGCRPAP